MVGGECWPCLTGFFIYNLFSCLRKSMRRVAPSIYLHPMVRARHHLHRWIHTYHKRRSRYSSLTINQSINRSVKINNNESLTRKHTPSPHHPSIDHRKLIRSTQHTTPNQSVDATYASLLTAEPTYKILSNYGKGFTEVYRLSTFLVFISLYCI